MLLPTPVCVVDGTARQSRRFVFFGPASTAKQDPFSVRQRRKPNVPIDTIYSRDWRHAPNPRTHLRHNHIFANQWLIQIDIIILHAPVRL